MILLLHIQIYIMRSHTNSPTLSCSKPILYKYCFSALEADEFAVLN